MRTSLKDSDPLCSNKKNKKKYSQSRNGPRLPEEPCFEYLFGQGGWGVVGGGWGGGRMGGDGGDGGVGEVEGYLVLPPPKNSKQEWATLA